MPMAGSSGLLPENSVRARQRPRSTGHAQPAAQSRYSAA